MLSANAKFHKREIITITTKPSCQHTSPSLQLSVDRPSQPFYRVFCTMNDDAMAMYCGFWK